MRKGSKYGIHRVLEPKGVLPQGALKIDNSMEIYDNEIRVDVKALNIDSASFKQLKDMTQGDEAMMAEAILAIVSDRGKMQNPITGSGGILIGKVDAIGEKLQGKSDLHIGDSIATLVSLSLTPLIIEEIQSIQMDIDRVKIKGKAILFESGIYAKLPGDMDEELVMAVLDVAGAPAQTRKLVKEGDVVLILGANGKSGLLCCYEAMKQAGKDGRVIGLVRGDDRKSC